MQLRLELAESPAPAAALWELVGEEQRRTASALLAGLIAQAVAGPFEPEAGGEGAALRGGGASGGRHD